jgi:uncharacterized protein YecE (DUF72 family)
VRIWLGTSGFQYRDWRGRFYPQELAQARWLEFYAHRFRTCELNVSFYRLPSETTFGGWRERTPADFVMVVKASRYLSHVKRLLDPDDSVDLFMRHARHLGPKLGPILLQVPPTMRAAPDRLETALMAFGRHGVRVAFEPRHETWFTDATYDVLRAHGAALVLADRFDKPMGPVVATAPWTFHRFHEGDDQPYPKYSDAALERWLDRLVALDVEEAWVFFNNDPGCWAVANARTFGELCAARGVDVTRFPTETPWVRAAA